MKEKRRNVLSDVNLDPLAMESIKELELPSELNKKIYWWSEKGAKTIGYCEAITKDGQIIKYTAFTEKEEDYKWEDKVIVGMFSENEISFSRSFMKDMKDIEVLKFKTVSKPPKKK